MEQVKRMVHGFRSWPTLTKVWFLVFFGLGSIMCVLVVTAFVRLTRWEKREGAAESLIDWVQAHPQNAFWMALGALAVFHLARVSSWLSSIADDVESAGGDAWKSSNEVELEMSKVRDELTTIRAGLEGLVQR